MIRKVVCHFAKRKKKTSKKRVCGLHKPSLFPPSRLHDRMKLMLRPEWRLWPLSSFLGILDLKTGVTVALLFAVFIQLQPYRLN
jgi:hypothetical protein